MGMAFLGGRSLGWRWVIAADGVVKYGIDVCTAIGEAPDQVL